jgi:hypothetical protein
MEYGRDRLTIIFSSRLKPPGNVPGFFLIGFWRDRLAAVFLFHAGPFTNVCLWHIASIRAHALNGRYWMHSGHWSALARNASAANDPSRSIHGNTAADFPPIDITEGVRIKYQRPSYEVGFLREVILGACGRDMDRPNAFRLPVL